MTITYKKNPADSTGYDYLLDILKKQGKSVILSEKEAELGFKDKKNITLKIQNFIKDLDHKITQNFHRRDVQEKIGHELFNLVADERSKFGELFESQISQIIQEALDGLFGLGAIQSLTDDPEITEIMVNGIGKNKIYYEKNGKLHIANDKAFKNITQLKNMIGTIIMAVNRRLDESSPMVDARLEDGSRVNAVINPIALDGAYLTIRKFKKGLSLHEMVKSGSIDLDVANYLEACVKARLNILVVGGTGSGKTTILNALSSFIPDTERIVTIEDSAELSLQQKHVLRLETKPANTEGKGAITIRHLVKNALRMRPDRIVVGEVRDDAVIDMLQAMNTGHEGSMSTAHANSVEDSISRLEMMFLSGIELPVFVVRQQIISAIDIIVEVSRNKHGQRGISCIGEVHKKLNSNSEVIVSRKYENPKFNKQNAASSCILDKLKSTGVVLPKWA